MCNELGNGDCIHCYRTDIAVRYNVSEIDITEDLLRMNCGALGAVPALWQPEA